jgi:hypothetical protein
MLITNVVLPGLDAIAMIRTLVDHPQCAGLQVIAVSAPPHDVVIGRGEVPAGIRVFAKPVPFGELERAVRSAAGGWQTLVAAS